MCDILMETIGLKPNLKPGKLVTFCGVDGSGKSSAISALHDHLIGVGETVYVIKMPSEECRKYSHFREYVEDYSLGHSGKIDIFSLFTVLLGDRLLTYRKFILPALSKGYWVLCDRYIFTTFAELTAFNIPDNEMYSLAKLAEMFPRPDFGFVMNVDAETALERVRSRPAEMHKNIDEYTFAKFVDGFREVTSKFELIGISTNVETKTLQNMIVDVVSNAADQ